MKTAVVTLVQPAGCMCSKEDLACECGGQTNFSACSVDTHVKCVHCGRQLDVKDTQKIRQSATQPLPRRWKP